MTEIRIVIDVVCEVSKSLETPSNVILRLPFWHSHHSARSSRVVIPGCELFIIRLIAALVRGISSSRQCLAPYAFSSRYWNTSSRAFFAKSGRQPNDNLIVSMLVYEPSQHILGVQSLHLRGFQSGGYGQRSGSGDTPSQRWNPIRRHDVVPFLTRSVFYHHQRNDALQPQKDCSKSGHSPFPPVCRK